MVMVAAIEIENVYFKKLLSSFCCLSAFSEDFFFFGGESERVGRFFHYGFSKISKFS